LMECLLIADLTGFTPLTEAVGPEEVRNLIAACHAAMAAVTESEGGRIERLIGDALVARFREVGHEDVPLLYDDPSPAVRASRSALALHGAVSAATEDAVETLNVPPLRVHVGVAGATRGEALLDRADCLCRLANPGEVAIEGPVLRRLPGPALAVPLAPTFAHGDDVIEPFLLSSFPGGLKAPVPSEAPRLAPESEHRRATAVFLQVLGLSNRAGRAPQDDVRGRCEAIAAAAAESEDGYLCDFVEDTALLLFGAPRSHADDPARAVRAAIHFAKAVDELDAFLRESLASRLRPRAGIATGLVVTGMLHAGSIRRYTAFGDAVNLASRLQTLSPAGEIWVSDVTADAAGPSFHFGKLLPQRVKGKSEPVAVRRLAHGF